MFPDFRVINKINIIILRELTENEEKGLWDYC